MTFTRLQAIDSHVLLFCLIRFVLVFLGGGTGALLRYVAGNAIMGKYSGAFPLGTVAINLTGSFLIGLLMTLLAHLHPHPNWRLLLVVGILGGYTTFSSFEYETFQAFRSGVAWVGILNVVGSVLIGYLAVWLGAAVTRMSY